MPVKKNGCWIYTDWFKTTTDSTPVSCSSSQSNHVETTSPETYESISELATSDVPDNNSIESREEYSILSQDEMEKFRTGMAVFQETFALPVTGRLDSATTKVISQRVCGVPDSPVQLRNDRSSLQSEMDNADHRTNRISENTVRTSTVLNTILQGRYMTSRPQYEIVTDLVSATTEVDYSVTEIGTETSSDVNTITQQGEISPTVSSSESKGTLSVLSDGRPTSVDTFRLKRRSLAEANYLPGLSRNKRSRSCTLPGGCSVVERFKNIGRPIRWRIQKRNSGDADGTPFIAQLSSPGYTNQKVRNDMTQAFRRWSEITPLKFQEYPTGPSTDVDIFVRFIQEVGELSNLNNFYATTKGFKRLKEITNL